MKRLGIAFLLLVAVQGFVSLGLLNGTAVNTYVESIRPSHLLMGEETRITSGITWRHQDVIGREGTSHRDEVLEVVPDGLSEIERQGFQKASHQENERETAPKRRGISPGLENPEPGDLNETDPLTEMYTASLDQHLGWFHIPPRSSPEMSPGRLNVPTPTFGGRQFWSDLQFFRGWRIQQHIYSGHFRLLDPSDIRRAWGTLDDCQKALAEEKKAHHLAPMSGTAVIALHGILRSSQVWREMEKSMKQDGVTFVRLDYPSTQKPIEDFAAQLQSVIQSLEGIDEIHLVAHSLGGLVVRKWCQEYSDPRVRRLVMIGTPNCGAEMADMLQRNWLYRGVFGPSGQQLIANTAGYISKLPPPTMEFAVIAGAKGTPDGYNPLIPGDDDGIVTLKSAFLPGAVDSLTVRGLHSFQPWNPEIIDATRRYLKTGALRESGVREPIPLEQ